jgi:hypothetical protein
MTNQSITMLRRESLSTARLASRLGLQPAQLEARRRAGELLAVRPPGSWEYLYPAWQFNGGGMALPLVPQLLQEAREAGLDEARLYELLTRRIGLVDAGHLVDHLRAGRHEYVLGAVRAAAKTERRPK